METEVEYNVDEERNYKSFIETYKIISFIMSVGLIYPNPKTVIRRIVCFVLILLSVAPVSFMILADMYNSWKRRDIVNIIRHSTIIGPFLAGFFKILIMFYKRTPAKEIMDEINREYISYNNLPHSYKNIINMSIKNNMFYSEKCWTLTVVVTVTAFPIMAVVSNIYSFLFKPEPQKYMIHDLVLPFMDPEDRFRAPIYEIIFVYMLYSCVIYIITFAGYDGFFGLCINHACLKMELYCKDFEEALKETSEKSMHEKIVKVIHEQNNFHRFVDLIQDTFNIWLGLILFATMIQIGSSMYLISEGYGTDIRYLIFMTGIVVYIYVPCRYSAKLKDMSMETATRLYCSGWEHVPYNSIRKMVLFMIARAQIPCQMTAFNLFIFDMDLFVRILNSSYSMYTLLRS